jgi:tRNA synthetases class II (D, K and N)
MIDYQKIASARAFYQGAGYQIVPVPWTIAKQAWDITSPKGSAAYQVDDKFLIASGEQSFLDQVIKNKLSSGKYQCITPCFRDEKLHTDLTRPYFLKLELIEIGVTDTSKWTDVIESCLSFFKNYLECRLEETALSSTDPLAISPTFDIVSSQDIELGSYGIRQHPLIGQWIYATGCAEPRLSQAIEMSKANNEPQLL